MSRSMSPSRRESFTNFSRALQNILAKCMYCRNRTSYENCKLKLCTCAQSHVCSKPCFGHMYKVSAWNVLRNWSQGGQVQVSWACFLSLVWSKLRLCSANHRPGYFSNLACDWLSIVWAYSELETENGPRSLSPDVQDPGGCFIKVPRVFQYILSKFVYCRNRTYENFKLKFCTCAQSHSTHAKKWARFSVI